MQQQNSTLEVFLFQICAPCFHLILKRLSVLHCLLHRDTRQHIFKPQYNSKRSFLTHLEAETVDQVRMNQGFSTQIKQLTYFFFCLLFFSFCFYLCFLLCFFLCLFFLLKFLYPGITAVCVVWQKKGCIMYKRNRRFALLVNKSLFKKTAVACSPTSVLILFISSFFLNALAALFCFSIHLLSSRLKRESIVSSVLIPQSVSLLEIQQQTF